MAVGFILNVMLARNMGSNAFGSWCLVYSLILISAPICCFGLDRLLLTEAPRIKALSGVHSETCLIRTSAIIVGKISCVIGAVALAIAVYLEAPLQWIIASMCVPLAALTTLSTMAVRARQMVFRSQLQEQLLRPLMLLGLSAAFILSGIISAAAIAVSLVMAFAVSLLANWGPAFKGAVTPIATQVTIPWKRAIQLWAATALLFASSRIDLFIIAFFLDASEVAGFHVCTRIAIITGTGAVLLNVVVGSHVAKLVAEGALETAQEIMRKSVRIIGGVTTVGMAIIILNTDVILGIFGRQYTSYGTTLGLLMFGQLVNVMTGPNGMILQVYHLERYALASNAIGIIVGVTATILLIPLCGLVGAGIGACLGTSLTQFLCWRLTLRQTPLDPSILSKPRPLKT